MHMYKESIIGNEEEAENFPIGTVAIYNDSQGVTDQTGVRVRGGWELSGTYSQVFPHKEVVGMIALVPVEVIEEFSLTGDGIPLIAGGHKSPVGRYVTKWTSQKRTCPGV